MVLLSAVARMAAAQALAVDTPQTTAMGTTFIAPAGWSIDVRGPATILEAPEHDSHIALVDVPKAADADAAVAAAWQAYRPDSKRPLKVATGAADQDGWQNRRYYTYETSPNERRDVSALAGQHGDMWTVVITDMSQPTEEKRLAQLVLVFSRLLPKGYQRETFAGKKPNTLDDARIAALSAFVERARDQLGYTWRGDRTDPERQGRLRGRLWCPRAWEARKGRCRHAVHDRIEHQGPDHPPPRQARRRWKARVGHPRDEPAAVVQAGDAATTQQVLVRHLICACTGLPRQDFEWLMEFKTATPESALAVLGTIQPTSKFGEMFQYSNGLAAAGG